MYPFYEKAAKAGIVNMCIHKGLMPRDYEQSWAGVWEYQTPRDLVKAAADWPQLNFIIYHGCFRAWFDKPEDGLGDFEKTGRIEWCSDLADIPAQNGASNIYAENGYDLRVHCHRQPAPSRRPSGHLDQGFGRLQHRVGNRLRTLRFAAVAIEAMRRMEIPEDMQEKHGFAPLGGADSSVKQQIFGLNSARLYNLDLQA